MFKVTIHVHWSDEKEFSDYTKYVENGATKHIGDVCVKGRVGVAGQEGLNDMYYEVRGEEGMIVIT